MHTTHTCTPHIPGTPHTPCAHHTHMHTAHMHTTHTMHTPHTPCTHLYHAQATPLALENRAGSHRQSCCGQVHRLPSLAATTIQAEPGNLRDVASLPTGLALCFLLGNNEEQLMGEHRFVWYRGCGNCIVWSARGHSHHHSDKRSWVVEGSAGKAYTTAVLGSSSSLPRAQPSSPCAAQWSHRMI